MNDKKIFKTIILMASIIFLSLESSVMAQSIMGMPGGGGMGSPIISVNENVPMEARIGEDIDIGVQHDYTAIFFIFPLSSRYDYKIKDIRLGNYFKKTIISDTRLQIGLDSSLLHDEEIKKLVSEPQSLAIDYIIESSPDKSKNVIETSNRKITFRTQNGFQHYVKSDFNRSGIIAALLSIVPGLGYYYADESTSAQYSFIFRTILLGSSFSTTTQFTPLWNALSEILFFAEAKNSATLVQKKDKVAENLREKGLADESQLVLGDLEAIKSKPKRFVKYPWEMFDLSLIAGVQLFPFGSSDSKGLITYSGISFGFRDYFVNMYYDQRDQQKGYIKASYYDDFYSFGWKNVYSIGYDDSGNQLLNIGVGRAYHTEWLDLTGGLSLGKYENPASLYFESRLNLAPPYFNTSGTYVEVHTPY